MHADNPHIVLLLGSVHNVLSNAHPVSAPGGGEQWVLAADRTEIEHLLRWLTSHLSKHDFVSVYGLTNLSAEERAEGGTEVYGLAHWAADEINGVASALLVVPR